MEFTYWFIIIGTLFVLMALSATLLKRLPLSTSMIYLAVGFLLGPVGFGLIQFEPTKNAELLERVTEVVLLVSVFGGALKLRVPLQAGRWKLPLRLASVSMVLTVGLIALVGWLWLGLPIGAGILLGAILAPTDPVLAADVQVKDPFDRDRLRFSLTGEAGLNDGSATPFILLGLGLLGLHDIGDLGWKWLLWDTAWGVIGGLLIGALTGTLLGRLVSHLRREHKQAVGLDDFLGLGLIALTYGLAMLLHTFGLLAVFAAGIALRRIEVQATQDKPDEEIRELTKVGADEEVATHPEKSEAYMAQAVLGFMEPLERIGEVLVVLLIGGMLSSVNLTLSVLWFVPLLFFVIRPVSVMLGLLSSHTTKPQRRLMSWFGVKGVGSIYYLTYVIHHGLSAEWQELISSLVLVVVAVSIVAHGLSVTPLMNLYSERHERKPGRERKGESLEVGD